MRSWTPARVAEAAGARLIAPPPGREGPGGVSIDSRAVAAGDLFVGLPGDRVDGGSFAAHASGSRGVGVVPW